MCLQVPELLFEFVLLPQVVVIQKGKVLPCGPSHAAVARCTDTSLRLLHDLNAGAKLAQNIAGPVRAAVIHDDYLASRPGLAQDAVNAVADPRGAVVSRDDNRD